MFMPIVPQPVFHPDIEAIDILNSGFIDNKARTFKAPKGVHGAVKKRNLWSWTTVPVELPFVPNVPQKWMEAVETDANGEILPESPNRLHWQFNIAVGE